MLPMHERAHTHARTRPRKVTYSSSEERLRLAPVLTVLGTHSISRSFPLPPQRMLARLAVVSVAAGPASPAHPVTSNRPRNQTPHAYAPCRVGITLHHMRVAGNTLEPSCCQGEVHSHGGTQPCIQAKSTRHPRGCVGRSPTIFFYFIFFL